MKIWLVLPAYNEEKGLPPLLDSVLEEFGRERLDLQILVVNDGSTDGTREILRAYADSHGLIALDNPVNLGLAETVKRGLIEACERAAPHDIIITMDSDNTHPAGLALRMVRSIREGSDVVIASRYREGSRVIGLSLHRRVLSYAASLIFRVVFPTPGVRDFTCGYRAYRVASLKQLIERHKNEFITERGFSCMVEILLRLREFDLVFVEVPLILRYDRKEGASKMHVLRTVMDTLVLVAKRRFS